MSKQMQCGVLLLVLVSALFLAGCGGYSGSSVSGSMGVGLYDDYYRYPYYPYGYHDHGDVHVDIDRDELEQRREQIKEKRPERREKVQPVRSRPASVGRPARGGRGGRR